MHVAGIDVGAGTAKAVILKDNEIISSSITQVAGNVSEAADEVTENVLKETGLQLDDIGHIISTGYGRNTISYANEAVSEIICHSVGIHFLHKQVRTIIEIGAQDSKIIKVNAEGRVVNFVMNDKCAAGTGRFLEVMARVLGVDLKEMGPLSLNSKNCCSITSTCTVFTETEVVSLRAQGKTVEDLIAGIHKAIASRIITMGSSINFEKVLAFSGGVAQNTGMKKALEDAGGIEILVPEAPQITGALGAALIAKAKLTGITGGSTH